MWREDAVRKSEIVLVPTVWREDAVRKFEIVLVPTVCRSCAGRGRIVVVAAAGPAATGIVVVTELAGWDSVFQALQRVRASPLRQAAAAAPDEAE